MMWDVIDTKGQNTPLNTIAEDINDLIGQGRNVLANEVERDTRLETVWIGREGTNGPVLIVTQGFLPGVAHQSDYLAGCDGAGRTAITNGDTS